MNMPDLSTTYLGLQLTSPLVASASPLSKRVETVQRLEEAGIAAVVMHSLFEEQIIRESHALDHYLSHGAESFAEALTYLPDVGTYSIGPELYLERIYRLKRAVHVPVIGSLNGVSSGGWIDYARMIEEAGADALELNIYYLPVEFDISSAALEDSFVELVRDIRKTINIPIAVKLSPYFTALPHFAQRLVQAGASGLVLFNRFYQPDIDLEDLEVIPNLTLSNSNELRLPLRWTALLSGRVDADFAITGGVHTAEDVLKTMMVGANVAMMASALLMYGPLHAMEVLKSVQFWMERHEYESLEQMRGSMRQEAVAEPGAFERANYMKVLGSYDTGARFKPLLKARERYS
jgi:dihydroorotate dehydrogenase (fumarate)